MRRIFLALTVAALVTAMLAGSAAPALAIGEINDRGTSTALDAFSVGVSIPSDIRLLPEAQETDLAETQLGAIDAAFAQAPPPDIVPPPEGDRR